MREICRALDYCNRTCKVLETKLKETGYKEKEIREIMTKARNNGRNEVLKERISKYTNRENIQIVSLVLTYNRTLPDVKI